MSIVGNRNWHRLLVEELLEDYRSQNKTLEKILKVLEEIEE